MEDPGASILDRSEKHLVTSFLAIRNSWTSSGNGQKLSRCDLVGPPSMELVMADFAWLQDSRGALISTVRSSLRPVHPCISIFFRVCLGLCTVDRNSNKNILNGPICNKRSVPSTLRLNDVQKFQLNEADRRGKLYLAYIMRLHHGCFHCFLSPATSPNPPHKPKKSTLNHLTHTPIQNRTATLKSCRL